MTTILNILRVFIISLLYVVFTILITISPIAISLSTTITQRENIKEVLVNIEAYWLISQIVIPENDSDESILDKYFIEFFKTNEIEVEVQKIAENSIDQIYDQLEKERETISLSIDTSSIKQALILGYIKNYAIGKQTNTDTLTILRCSNELIAKYDKSCPPELRDINNKIDSMFEKFSPDSELINLNKNTYNYINNIRDIPKYLITFTILTTMLIVVISSNRVKGLFTVSIIAYVVSILNIGTIYVLKHNTQVISNVVGVITNNSGNQIDNIVQSFFTEYILRVLNNSISIIYGIFILYGLLILLYIAFNLSRRLIKKE